MLIIYDETGKIITEQTKKEEIQGSLYSIEVTVLENKILDKVNTDVLPHVPVFKDKPLDPLEKLRKDLEDGIRVLSKTDMEHDTRITVLELEVAKINALLNQMITEKVGA